MPEMDGYTSTSAIREWEQEKNAPSATIIALSGITLKLQCTLIAILIFAKHPQCTKILKRRSNAE